MEKIYKEFKEEFELELGLDAIINQLQKIRAKCIKEGKISLDLDVDSGWSNYTTYISGKRLETDEELQQRIRSMNVEKEKEKTMKEKRRKEYLKLKKEFENESN